MNVIWRTPPEYAFPPNPKITLLKMYELMKCEGTYYHLPDNMKKMHPFVFGSIHIKSAIDREYMAVLVDARKTNKIKL